MNKILTPLALLALCFVVIIVLTACATAPVVDIPKPAIQEKKKVDIDPTLVQDCPTVALLPGDKEADGQGALNLIAQLSGALSVCWHRHHDLSDVAVKAFNLDTPDAASAVGPASAPVPAVSK